MVQESETRVYLVDRATRLVHLGENRRCAGDLSDRTVAWGGHDVNTLVAQGFSLCPVCFAEQREEPVEEAEEEGEAVAAEDEPQ